MHVWTEELFLVTDSLAPLFVKDGPADQSVAGVHPPFALNR